MIVSRVLVALIIPLSSIAIPIALALIVTTARRPVRALLRQESASTPGRASDAPRATASWTERVVVALCTILALIGTVALVMNGVRRGVGAGPAIAYVSLIFALAAPALFWRSRWRVSAEGLATIGVSVVATLSGFSIGFAFVPLLVGMILVCIRHLRSGGAQAASNPLSLG